MRALAVHLGVVLAAGVVAAQNPASFSSTNLSSVTTVRTGGWTSNAVEVGDFTGDGVDDVLVAHTVAPQDLVLLKNDGSGNFSANSLGSVPGIVQVVSGRFNADSLLDIAWIQGSAGNVGVRLGNGNGTFGPTNTLALGATLSSIAVSDLDGDAKVDLAVTNSTAGTVTILKGDGLGGFAPLATLPGGPSPTSIRIANFNGDGRRDIVVANAGTPQITLLLNAPSGFLAPITIHLGDAANALDTGDIDADQHVDIAVCTPTDVEIFFGSGTGVFSTQHSYATGRSPSRVSMFDASGDGLLDIVTADATAGCVTVLANLGAAGFALQREIAIGPGPIDMSYGHFNSDVYADMALANGDSPGRVWILRGPLQPIFDVSTLVTPGVYPGELHALDIDLDGDLDLVATGAGSGFLIYRNNANGLTGPVGVPGYDAAWTLGIGDFNNDGRPDVLEGFALGSGELQFGQANGSFVVGNTALRVGRSPRHIVVADFDQDGNADFAVTNEYHSNISVRLGDGTGHFGPMVEYVVGWRPSDLVAADLDGDGNLDLAVATWSNGSPGIVGFRGNGSGAFTPMGALSNHIALSLAAADLDGDGDVDLVANSNAGEALILLGNGNGTFVPHVVAPGAAWSWSITLADLDRDGDLDISATDHDGDNVGLIEQLTPGVFRFDGRVGVGHQPTSVASGDFDGDGAIDLAVSNSYNSYSLSVLDHSSPAVPDIAVYCTAKTNSLGCVPELAVSGLPSISSPQACRIQASQELSHAPGTLFYGSAPLSVPFSGGFKCVAGPVRRTPLQDSGGTPGQSDCSGFYAFDINAWMRGGNDPALLAGTPVFCQFWSRDAASPAPINLTAAVHLVICP